MKNFQSHYNELKSLLKNGIGHDKETLRENFDIAVENANKDINLLDFDDADKGIVFSLKHHTKRIHRSWTSRLCSR